MQSSIESARKGSVDAMMDLVLSSRPKVSYICRTLFPEGADRTEAAAFKAALSEMLSGRLAEAADVEKAALRKAVSGCKTGILKKDNKAFRIPPNFNGLCTPASVAAKSADIKDSCAAILAALPPLYRFVYTLHAAAGYTSAEIAGALELNQKSVETILANEKENLNRACEAAGVKLDADAFRVAVRTASALEAPGSAAENEIRAYAEKICEPIQKAEKQKKTRLAIIAGAVAAVALIIVLIVVFATGGGGGNSPASGSGKTYTAEIVVQDYGTITLELDESAAPITVQNFVSLAQSGFYDSLTFHRIIDGFMIQGGDPEGNGSGGSDTKITGEFSSNGWDNPISHDRGVISMARSSDPNSASSQFFICQQDSHHLDGSYAAFGHVTSGMEVVDAICADAEPTDDNGTIPPEAQPVITSITVTENN